ncbi:MAG TPA: M48 family metalloprotease, partial [Polyangiaceae bacterium]|nr:M48 family metalloprotease [Polyangiaceae bacterium]
MLRGPLLRGLYRLGVIVALAHLGACSSKSKRTTPAQYPQQPYPQQPYPQQPYPQQQGAQQQYPQQGQPYPQQPYPQQQAPQQPQPQQPATQPPATQQPMPALPGATALDPINTVNLQWLRQRAQQLLTELVAALPADSQRRVQGIPLIYDDKPGEVNAFAACSQGRALMAVTDEMLRIMDFLAQSQANDERFGTRKVDELIRYVGQYQQPDRPLALPGIGFFDVQQQLDAQKVNRQHQLFDEQLAFVLGHELAHHHLGHLPCTARPDALGTADIARALSD